MPMLNLPPPRGVEAPPMTAHLIAGLLLGLSFACLVLPALVALSGPDREEGSVSEGWLQRDKAGRK